MLRLLHCADAHLDTPYTIAELEQPGSFRAELQTAFSSMMLYIRKNDIRLLLISGDLFDHASLTQETTTFLCREFASVPLCHIVITPGSHDFYASDTVYAAAAFPENVHLFRTPTLSSVTLHIPCADGRTECAEIWGFANTAPDMTGYMPFAATDADTRRQLSEKPQNTYRIFAGHVSLAGTGHAEPSPLPVVTKEQLAACGFDYAALGGEHHADGIRRIRGTYYGYAGCLVGRCPEESGFKGAVSGTLDRGEHGETVFSVRRLRIARRHFEALTVDLGENTITTPAALTEALARCIREAVKDGTVIDRDTTLTLTVRGSLDAQLMLSEDMLREALGQGMPCGEIRLLDETTLAGIGALETDPTLRGAFYRTLSEAIGSDNETLRETAALALRLGLQQL